MTMAASASGRNSPLPGGTPLEDSM
jgi:hypothetical protein